MKEKCRPTRWIEKPCPECGGRMYEQRSGPYGGVFCKNGDYADIDVISNAEYLVEGERITVIDRYA